MPDRNALLTAVDELGHLASPFYLKELGFEQTEIEQAVADGDLRWTREGDIRRNDS